MNGDSKQDFFSVDSSLAATIDKAILDKKTPDLKAPKKPELGKSTVEKTKMDKRKVKEPVTFKKPLEKPNEVTESVEELNEQEEPSQPDIGKISQKENLKPLDGT